MFRSGDRPTTQTGYRNRHGQVCEGSRGVRGTDHCTLVYRVRCSRCGLVYGANGTDGWQRKCPKCQGGKPGIPF